MKVHPPSLEVLSIYSRIVSFLTLSGMVGLLSAVYFDWEGLWDTRLLAVVSLACAGLTITFSCGRIAGFIRLGLCYLLLWVFLWSQAAGIAQQNRVFFGLPSEKVTVISGRLSADSTLSARENQVLSLALDRCESQNGSSADAHGMLLAIGGSPDFLLSGTDLALDGSLVTMEDGALLFLTDSIVVLASADSLRNDFLTIRKRLLEWLLHKFEPLDGGPAELCGLLLFGRTEEAGSFIKQLSVDSGCAHILALSGMHLQFYAGLAASILALFLGKRWGKTLSIFPMALFLGIAGAKPSLVRSAVMYALTFNPHKRCSARKALFIACSVQLFLFPHTIATLGCLLSYSSLAGMMVLQESASMALQRMLPRKLAMIITASAGALLFSGPCAIVAFGCWHPIGLAIAPMAGPLAFLYMGLGLLWLIAPIPTIGCCIQSVYGIFMQLLRFGADWSLAHPLVGTSVYLLIYLAVLLTVVGFLLYACRIARTRSTYNHEMGLSLRFPECNHRVVG